MLISFHPVFHHLHPFHRSKSFRASNPPGIKVTNHTHGRLELPLPKMYYYDEGGGHNYVRVYNTWNFSATSTRLYESIKHFSLLSSVIDQVQLLLLLLSLSLPQLLRAGKDVLVSFHPVFSHDFRGGLHTFESAFAPCLYVYLNLVFVHPHFPLRPYCLDLAVLQTPFNPFFLARGLEASQPQSFKTYTLITAFGHHTLPDYQSCSSLPLLAETAYLYTANDVRSDFLRWYGPPPTLLSVMGSVCESIARPVIPGGAWPMALQSLYQRLPLFIILPCTSVIIATARFVSGPAAGFSVAA